MLLENKSKRECEKLLIAKSPDLPKPERVIQITPEQTQITITLNSELVTKLEELKSIYSHINPNATYAKLLEIMADQILKKKKVNTNTIKQKVFIRDKGCCTYKDHKTNQRCNSSHSVFLWRSNYARQLKASMLSTS